MEKLHLIPGKKFSFNDELVVIETVTSDGISVSDEKGNYTLISYDQLHANLIQKEVKPSTSQRVNPFKFESKIRKLPVLSEEKWEIINKRKRYIKACEGLPHGELMRQAIVDAHKAMNDPGKEPCISAVRNWRIKYQESNHNPESLLPDNSKKGKYERIDPYVTDICLRKIHENYLTLEKTSMQKTMTAIFKEIEDENINRLSHEKLKYPSFEYLRRLINDIPKYERDLARDGANYVRAKYRQVMNQPKTYPNGMHVGQMDHTILDVMIVDEEGRLLGRPTLTIFIHVPSRCIYGYYLGFNPPSLNIVAKCFKHAVSPKPDLTNKYVSIKNKWLPFGPFDLLMVDNGLEFHASDFERLCSYMYTEILYCGRGTPWEKPNNERFFRTLNTQLIHVLPGTTKSNPKERKDYKSEKLANITLDMLKAIMNKYIVDVYHEKPHQGLKGESPRQAWQRLINPSQIPLMTDIDDIDLIFSKSDRLTVDHRGVTLEDIWYSNRNLLELRKQFGDVFETEIRYDEDDLSKIWVFLPNDNDNYIVVEAKDKEYTKNLSLYMHKTIKDYCRKNGLPKDNTSWRIALAEIYDVIRNEPKKIGKRAARFIEPSYSNKEPQVEDEQITIAISESNTLPADESSPTIAFTTKVVKRPGGYDE
ncbi:Mu transposase C-terminal domain-containing protein [Methylobacillus caricis]|uniref:Mu transposase C-terminal domain-containing protein n=1 Tax=Methylobacillus caricis TaxID=1971611 RepID=UPI001CFFA6FD|nr:Mu transposase C-terminal domain-containing protein [Methylobacillus caricis]MCB5188866.1 Mu transposase C-terminal domain-containing protein [Methylobacillus caricis]